MKTNQTFGQAIAALENGLIVSQEGWKGMFVFRQVPSTVPAGIVPKMTSLPQSVKDVIVSRGGDITYQNQFCIVYPDNSFHGWQPSGADCLATTWCIHEAPTWEEQQHEAPFVVAGETVGAAKPL